MPNDASQFLGGGCFCGAVRYRLTRAPMFVHCCHCRECQSRTGSAFVVNAIIETSEIQVLKGTPERFTAPTTSGRPHILYRCADCQVTVWSDYGDRGWAAFVRGGTLDDPGAAPPDIHIFTESKVPWMVLPEGVPAVPIYYDMQALWPAESWARREAAAATGG